MKPPHEAPGPGQESVWDYPRPPALMPFEGAIKVWFEDQLLVDAPRAHRVLETSHPPTFYIDPSFVNGELLRPTTGRSVCEWKGEARYHRLEVGDRIVDRVAWSYPEPTPAFVPIAGHLCFYPSKVRCFVNGEAVSAQEGDFYGGWITRAILGPFKGGPGTWGW